MKILKYELDVEEITEIDLPQVAHILSLQVQRGKPCIWVKVDPDSTKIRRKFYTFATGPDLPEQIGNHVGTYQLYSGDVVFHVFDDNFYPK